MLPLRYPLRWKIAGALLLGAVLFMAVIPAAWPWHLLRGPDWIETDKWLHGVTFFLLALWYSGQYARRSYHWLGAGLIAFGALIEGCQLLVAYRAADWWDLAADAVGVAAGLAVALAGLGGWSLKMEAWYRERFG